MRRFIMAAVIAGGIAVPVFGLASSSSASGSSVQCAKLAGSISGTVTFSKCTPTSKTNKSLSGAAGSLVSGGILTWKKSGQTTEVSDLNTTQPNPPQGACPNKWQEYDTTATVTGGNSTYTNIGDVVSSRTCVKGSTIKLVAGSQASL